MQGKAKKFNPSGRYFPSALVTAAQIWSLSSVAGGLGTMTDNAIHAARRNRERFRDVGRSAPFPVSATVPPSPTQAASLTCLIGRASVQVTSPRRGEVDAHRQMRGG
jgi:hypothetical protein